MIEINLKNLKFGLFLAFLAIFTFAILNTVKAQADPILIDGDACVPNFASCSDPNQTNLIEAIRSGSIKITSQFFSSTNLISDVYREFGIEANNVCINNAVNEVISVRKEQVRGGDPSEVIYSNGQNNDHWRACGAGLQASTAPVSGGWDITGCCPADYQLVTRNDLQASGTGVEYQNDAICCKIIPGTRPGQSNYPHSESRSSCADVNNNVIDYNALGISNGVISTRQPIDGDGNDFGEGSSLVNVESPTGSPEVCPANYLCAMVDLTKGRISPLPASANAVKITNTLSIISPSLLTTSSIYACTRCLKEGEAIAVTGDNLQVCSSRGTSGLVLETPLIANSVQATLASLRADDTNRPLLNRCLEQGGIYIAIGCVDPTPVGIITGLIRLAFGIMGGVALIQLILAGIAYQQGEEEKIAEARSRVLATLAGIAVLVFSVLILRIIGVNVLDVIPIGSV